VVTERETNLRLRRSEEIEDRKADTEKEANAKQRKHKRIRREETEIGEYFFQ